MVPIKRRIRQEMLVLVPIGPSLDNRLTVRVYEPLVRQLVELPFPSLLELSSTPEKSLIVIILLDHIARNTNRGEKQAWVLTTVDPVALKLADHCIKEGHDMAVPPHKRHFYYFPYMRSEDLANQELSLAKNAMLVWDTRHCGWDASIPAAQRGLDHVIKFYRIIEKYGRFPYRNAVLKRENTAEEQKFMDEGGFKFVLEE